MKTLINCKNISKYSGGSDQKHKILDNVSVQINEGEFVSVMGPSGSGKSTLLFALSGMDYVDDGKVIFDGQDLAVYNENELSDIRRMKMGFIFQQPTLLKNLNILDNIILPSLRDSRNDTKEVIKKARILMAKAGIEDLEKRDVTQTSGGQLQRVGICRALINDPKIIFGDELTGALNSTSAHEVMNLLTEIHKNGATILLVTHDPKVAARTERVLYILDGKIVGEYNLEKFEKKQDDLKSREDRLTTWLAEMKF